MIDPISMLTGAGLLGAGVLAGRLTKRRSVCPPNTVVATCPCGHTIALHDPDDKLRCRAEVERKAYYKSGEYAGHQWVSCACQRYMGPELLTDVWAGPGQVTP